MQHSHTRHALTALRRLAAASLVGGLLTAQPVAAEVPGYAIAFACKGCHSGPGSEAKPTLKGLTNLTTRYLQQTLLDFKYDHRESTLMGRIAKGYTDSELNAVAQYLSTP